MLELYHYDRSSAAQKVRILLAEKGLEWKSHEIDTSLATRDHLKPEYLKLNPRGLVPTLVHDGQAIRESQVILEYIEDVFPEPAFRPADPVERARMRVWTKTVDEGLHVNSRVVGMCIVVRHLYEKAGPEAMQGYYGDMQDDVRRRNDRINIEMGLDSPLLPPAIGQFKKVLTDMNAALGEKPWLAGNTYSLADISLGVYVTRLMSFQMGELWAGFEYLNSWHGRFMARAAYAEGVTKWGDVTTENRIKHGQAALPKIREIWRAIKV